MKKLVLPAVFLAIIVATFVLFLQNRQTAAEINALQERLVVARARQAELSATLPQASPANKPQDVDSIRRELEKEVARIHQLRFKRPINYQSMKVTEFHGYLTNKLYEVYSGEELRNYGRSMALLGLVPEGTDLAKVITSLYGEQVAAFYDQHKGELYTFSDFQLSENIDRMMLAHEITHALQDQTFILKNFPIETKTNDDLALATAALVEGDATMLMTMWYMQTLSEGFDWRSLFQDLASMFVQNTEQLAAAPAYFRETLLFPYQGGNEFVMAVYGHGGYEAVNKAFLKPPVSTEQILHPNKFLPNREDPIEVTMPDLKIAGWKAAMTNTLGELGMRVLLKEHVTPYEANRAAHGWGGDRYLVYEDTSGEYSILWLTVWDTEIDAQEFHEAYDAAAHRRVGLATMKHAVDEAGFSRFGNETLQIAVRKQGSQVTTVLGSQDNVGKILAALPK